MKGMHSAGHLHGKTWLLISFQENNVFKPKLLDQRHSLGHTGLTSTLGGSDPSLASKIFHEMSVQELQVEQSGPIDRLAMLHRNPPLRRHHRRIPDQPLQQCHTCGSFFMEPHFPPEIAATDAAGRTSNCSPKVLQSPTTMRLKRMKDGMREMSQWSNLMIQEDADQEETVSEENKIKKEDETETGTEAPCEEAVEWKMGKCLILHFKCPCEEAHLPPPLPPSEANAGGLAFLPSRVKRLHLHSSPKVIENDL
ncbi:hypothetical protein HAX54_044129 [Datura stramonium]|uniref:Uncharacterized protein n=1 Tax=Datura stramonium TaxID=4076 RepID=A0ABS8W6B6_DATST|nr:hypothetical protein [Datura stramonium]